MESRDNEGSASTQVMWNRLTPWSRSRRRPCCARVRRDHARGRRLSAGVHDTGGHMLSRRSRHARPRQHDGRRGSTSIATRSRPCAPATCSSPTIRAGHRHLFDYVMVTPVPRRAASRPSCRRHPDVGGVASAEARSVYEEGTRVPHMRLREGQIDEKIFAIIMANSRNPIEARVTVADRLQRRAARLADMMRSSSRLDRRAGAVILTSREATREAIRKRRAAVQDATCSTGTTPTIPRSRSAT